MKARLARFAQLTTATLSAIVHRVRGRHRRVSWVIGPTETAGIVRDMARAVPNSCSAVLIPNPMFQGPYDWSSRPKRGKLAARLAGVFEGPWWLGRIAAQASGAIYVGAAGYLWSVGRDVEYRFLRRHGVHIVCYFTGSDIRSPALMRELEDATGEPNIATWLRAIVPGFDSPATDAVKRKIGEDAAQYADLIFTAQNDQRGYLPPTTRPFLYFHPDDDILAEEPSEIGPAERVVVVHAPSSPVIKGTQLVRAAVRALHEEGFDFEYVELQNVSNDVVKSELQRAHIALNEFFAFVPGVFAVEAMAAGCAVLTRAEEAMEPQLPKGSDLAWMVTRHHEVQKNLRILLQDHGRITALARAGRRWVLEHAAVSVTGPSLVHQLDRVLSRGDGSDVS